MSKNNHQKNHKKNKKDKMSQKRITKIGQNVTKKNHQNRTKCHPDTDFQNYYNVKLNE